jgi:hypothetical protein
MESPDEIFEPITEFLSSDIPTGDSSNIDPLLPIWFDPF